MIACVKRLTLRRLEVLGFVYEVLFFRVLYYSSFSTSRKTIPNMEELPRTEKNVNEDTGRYISSIIVY